MLEELKGRNGGRIKNGIGERDRRRRRKEKVSGTGRR